MKAKRRCLRKTLLPGVCRLTGWGLAEFKGPALDSETHWNFFSLPSMALTILAKTSPSNHSPCFFLWELKSEAQTLNLIIFLYAFFFSWPIPLPLKCSFSDHSWAEALLLMALSPFQSLLLSSEVRANFSRSFFTPWHGSYWCQPIPTPTLQSGVGVSPPQANRYTSPHLSSSFSDSRSVREPKFSRVTVFSQPTGICKTHLKKFAFYFSDPCPHIL